MNVLFSGFSGFRRMDIMIILFNNERLCLDMHYLNSENMKFVIREIPPSKCLFYTNNVPKNHFRSAYNTM